MNAIETRKLTRDFGKGRGLFDLDLKVKKGRVHGFLGPNGAGKTTAIRLLLDFLRPDRGAARILGHDHRIHATRLRRHIGYVPGELAMPVNLLGREYITHSERLRGGVDREWRKDLVHRLRVDLDERIGTLSKGNRQKIALVDALQHRPELLIMDEPTDGLDPLLRQQVKGILRDHVKDGGTVFMSSHIVHEIQTICDDVSIVIGGRLRSQARIQDLIDAEGLVVLATVEDPAEATRSLLDAGAADVAQRGNRIRVRARGDPLPVLAELHHLGATQSKLRQGDLEELFLRLYAEEPT